MDAPYEINLKCDGIDYYDYETNKDNFCNIANEYKELVKYECQLLREHYASS